MTNKKLKMALMAAAFAVAGAAHAQSIRPTYQFPELTTDTGAASMQLGNSPVYFSPKFGVAVGRDDNVLMSPANERASTIAVYSPGLRLDARNSNSVFQVAYEGQLGRYADSEEDNYSRHALRSQYDVAFDRRNFLRLGLDYIRGHDPRGSTDRAILGSPDKYRLTNPYATYAFGAPGAAGRVEAYYGTADKRYLNNRASTEGFDRKSQEVGSAFFWRIAPKTYLVAEARRNDFSYRLAGSPLNSEERRYFGGVMWEATAATTGIFKVGRIEKRFDSVLPEHSGTAWEALVTWAPRTYSKLDFYAARTTNETSGLGNFILSDLVGVRWNHAWNSTLSTEVNFQLQKDDYKGFNRSDDVASLGFKVGYKFRRWMTFGAQYAHTQRDSNIRDFEYDRNIYLLTATASM